MSKGSASCSLTPYLPPFELKKVHFLKKSAFFLHFFLLTDFWCQSNIVILQQILKHTRYEV